MKAASMGTIAQRSIQAEATPKGSVPRLLTSAHVA